MERTTLVDKFLQQSGTFASHQKVDKKGLRWYDLEEERGITNTYLKLLQ